MNTQKINIPSYIKEANYRYKMPKMDLKQESRLNGVKTNIFNLDELAKSLRVPGEALIKFWCAELGASKEKKSILKGQHNYDTLLVQLDRFIERYVLCKKCNLPETTMFVKQKQLQSKCNSCGNINQLDSMHRAGAYLIKADLSGNEFNAGQTAQPVVDKKKDKNKKKEEEKVIEEVQTIQEKPKTGEIKEEDGLQIDSVEIQNYIKLIDEAVKTETIKEIWGILVQAKQELIGFTNEFRYYLLICGLFPPERNIVKHWTTYEECFIKLVQEDGDIGIKHFMQAIIQYFIRKYPEQLKYCPTFMKVLYEQEILAKDFLVKWQNKKKKLDKNSKLSDRKAEKVFRETIAQFIAWLEQDEEEEDDEEEGEENEDQPDGSNEEQKVQENSPTKNIQAEAIQKQKELIEKQKQEQLKNIEAKKEEATQKQSTTQNQAIDGIDRVNVMNIQVEDNFNVDDI